MVVIVRDVMTDKVGQLIGRFAVLSPIWGTQPHSGATYEDHPRLVGKRVGYFLFSVN